MSEFVRHPDMEGDFWPSTVHRLDWPVEPLKDERETEVFVYGPIPPPRIIREAPVEFYRQRVEPRRRTMDQNSIQRAHP